MSSYLYSKWLGAPPGGPVEFYSELDALRNETRKVEVFADGKLGYASRTGSSQGTELGLIPVPSLVEIKSQAEFEAKEIDNFTFEQKWREATAKG